MAIHEECGVFGVICSEPADVSRIVYYGLYALQHRGQESCGIVVNDDGVFASHKDLGLVGEVFSCDVLERFPQGTMAVGHTRYGTTGASSRRNCQPIDAALHRQAGNRLQRQRIQAEANQRSIYHVPGQSPLQRDG